MFHAGVVVPVRVLEVHRVPDAPPEMVYVSTA